MNIKKRYKKTDLIKFAFKVLKKVGKNEDKTKKIRKKRNLFEEN